MDIEPEPTSKRKKKTYHPIAPITSSNLKLNWSLVKTHPVGLINRDETGRCINICYLNSIIQCLGNAAPFAQWLISNDSHLTCKLSSQSDNTER